MILTKEEVQDIGDRRHNIFRLDKSINLGNLIGILALTFTILHFGVQIIERMDDMQFKVDMMWKQFSITLVR